MRKLVLGLVGAAALTLGTGANASVTIDGSSPGVLTGTSDNDVTFSTFYGTANGGTPFDEFVTFTETLAGNYGFTLTTTATLLNGAIVAATDVDFTHVWLSGDFGVIDLLADVDNTDVNEDYHLELFGLDPGSYTLHVQGTRGRTSTYSGSISFAAVPEPATWAMMLLGFGAIGFALRRRRALVLAQAA